jgi:hypothetical protein
MTEQVAEARRVERAMDEVTENHDEPLEPDPHLDRARTFSAMGFSRMRTRWTSEEQEVIDMANSQAAMEVDLAFGDVWRILNRLYEIVREPLRDGGGQVVTDEHGRAVWRPDDFGSPVEDWSHLTESDKETFLHQITTRLVLWEQRAAEFKGEALFAKAMWEERFALSFTRTPQVDGKRPTEADRTQNAQGMARDQRYLAIYMTVRSNKAEALVRSMERVAMRFSNTLAR